jgi:RNA polymerase sigma factor (sigma-70 family)
MNITEDLINRCKKKEQVAMAELFRILAPKIKGICYRYSGNKADAEDLLQESFILIFTKISSFKSEGSFEGWARRITVNRNLNWLKKNKLHHTSADFISNEDQEEEFDEEKPGISPDELMMNIAKLPDGYRTILNLYAIEEFSHKEIGEKLGISESTSRSQYARAKKKLQQLLVKEKSNERI